MYNKPYNVLYNNFTGRVIVQRNNRYVSPSRRMSNNLNNSYTNDLEKKIQELSKSINTPDNVSIQNNNSNNSNNSINLMEYTTSTLPSQNQQPIQGQQPVQDQQPIQNEIPIQNQYQNQTQAQNIIYNENKRKNIENSFKKAAEKISLNKIERNVFSKQNLIYGIKKTILSEFNSLYQSLNSNDFKIGLNKNYNKNSVIFDSFYLFPNISEINTITETNIINEKKIELFNNNTDMNDIQYFPIDFVPCGVNIPLRSSHAKFKKLIIKNIFWNIFQSINSNNYELDELLCIVPQKNEFVYRKINLQINVEIHSQVSSNISKNFENKILPYKNDKIKYSTPANSCLYKVLDIKIDKLNGSYFENLEIELVDELSIDCALLCLRISVPEESIELLKGFDKNNNTLFGNIPFSQFILNFDYELV